MQIWNLHHLNNLLTKRICDKIVTLWNEASATACPRNKGAKQILNFETKLDKLFDILVCKCPIVKCDALICSDDCDKEVS